MDSDISPRRVRLLAWTALVFTLAVVGFGAFVRATGSGAGCGAHWPTCNGDVVPRAASLQTRIEYTHRVTSGLALVLVAAVAVAAWRGHPAGHRVRRAAGAALGLMLLEAAIGAMLVKMQWVAGDASASRAVAQSVHLMNTFLLLGAQALTCAFAAGIASPRVRGQQPLAPLLGAALLLMAVLGTSGAIAALGDTLFPASTLAEGFAQDVAPAAHFLLRLRILHPLLALATAGATGAAALSAVMLRPHRTVRRAALAVGALFGAQLLVGLLNVALLAPVPLQLVHLLIADALWIALVWLSAGALAAPRPSLLPGERLLVPAP